MCQDIYNCICQNIKNNEDILSSMSTLQPNWCLKIDFQKVDQHAGGKWLIHDAKRHKDNQLQRLKLPCRISKLSSWMWHPWRWGNVDHQIPSIKVLFKTNFKSHKHPGIKYYHQRARHNWWTKENRTHTELILEQSFWTGTKVIRRKHIIQPTGFGACSSTCCQWDGEDVLAPWERSNSHSPVRVQKACVNQFI